MEFTQEYLGGDYAISDEVLRDTIDEILQVATSATGKPEHELEVLDVGCGRGYYLFAIEKRVRRAVGVEPVDSWHQLALRDKAARNSKAEFVHGMIETAPVRGPFDLAISLTTVEHMPNARLSMERVIELLKPGGVLYLTAPNRLWPIECHYHLPFLSWLPLPLADLYLRVTGKGSSFKDCSYSRTYWGMKRLFRGLPVQVRFALPSNTATSYIGCGDKNPVRSFIRRFGIWLIGKVPAFWAISKGFIMVIQKKP